MSSGSNTTLVRALQTAEGTAAGVAETWFGMRFNGGGLGRTLTSEDDPEIGGSGGALVAEGPAAGTLQASLWYAELDWAFETLLRGTFTTDVLEDKLPAEVARFWTMEEFQVDLVGGDEYLAFIDTVVTAINLSWLSPNARVTAEVVLSAVNGLPGSADLRNPTALEAANVFVAMRTGAEVTGVEIDDVAVATSNIRVRQLDLQIARASEDEPQIDVAGRGGISAGDLTVTIVLNTYDEDRTHFNSLFDGTARKIEWISSDVAGNDYAYEILAAVPSAGEVTPPERNTSRFQTLTYVADNLKITRTSV